MNLYMKKISFAKVLLLSAVVLLIASCKTYTYIPNVINVPLLEEKKEFQLAGYFSLNHVEFQSAYAVTNNFAVMANGYWATHNRNFTEVGLGFYNNIREHQYFEMFSGYGYANQNVRNISSDNLDGGGRFPHSNIFNDDWTSFSAIANYHRFFAQANYGIKWKSIDCSFTLRTSYIYYPHYFFEYQHVSYPNNSYDTLSYSKVDVYGFGSNVIEPVISFKYKFKYVNLFAQGGFALNTDGTVSQKIYHPISRWVIFSTGIQADIRHHPRKKKRESE